MLLQTGIGGARYVTGFVRDTGGMTSRLRAAEELEKARQAGGRRLLVPAEPAPYITPPMDLFGLQVVLVPKDEDPAKLAQSGDIVVEVLEGRTPISWADKEIWVRQDK
jgi:hypothetical protein